MTEKDFRERYCTNCGYEKCKGPNSDTFNECKYRTELNYKCSCYHEEKRNAPLSDFQQGVLFAKTGLNITTTQITIGRCYGTKECEECTCGGNESKCDFYPKKREMKNG